MSSTKETCAEHLRRHLKIYLPALLSAVALTFWCQTLFFEFVWDDRYYIVLNEALRSPGEILRYFSDATTHKSMGPYPYRPIRTLLFGLLTWMNGSPTAWSFHLLNILFHLGASILIFFITARLLVIKVPSINARLGFAFTLALIFSIHPVATEVVAWSKCLDDLSATFFILLSFYLAQRAWSIPQKTHWPYAGFSLAALALSLFSKESTAAMFLVTLYFLKYKPRKKDFMIWFSAQYLIFISFLAVRHHVLGHTAQVAIPLSGSYLQTLWDMLPVVFLYTKAFSGLTQYLPDYRFMMGGHLWFSSIAWAGLVFLLFFVISLVVAFRKNSLIFLGLCWIALGVLPVSNIVPMMQYYAERFSYLPFIGVLFIASGAANFILSKKRFFLYILPVLIALLGLNSVIQLQKWRDELALMSYAFHRSPYSTEITLNYLTALDNAEHAVEFQNLIEMSQSSLLEHPKGRWLWARHLSRQGKWPDALDSLLQIKAQFSDHPDFLLNLGFVYAQLNEIDNALRIFRSVTVGWPQLSKGWTQMGLALSDLKRYEEAMRALEQGLEINPHDVEAWKALSHAAWLTKDWILARKAFQKLIQLEPENKDHRFWLEQLKQQW